MPQIKKYCKRYRERNEEKLRKTEKEMNKLEREHRKYVCPEKYKKHFEQDRIRVREYRERKKAENQSKLSEPVPQTPQPSSSSSSQDVRENTPTQGNESVFCSKQSLHRSVKQAEKYLPNSLRKKNEVLNNLASKYILRIKLKNKRCPKKQYLSEDQEHRLLEMLRET